MNDNQKIERGNRAKQILNDDVYQESFEQQEKDIIKLWKESVNEDAEFRERLWYQYQGLIGAQEHLKRILGEGKSAETRIRKDIRKSTKRG